MQYDHLCHSMENTTHPDHTACRALSIGFSGAQQFIEAICNIIMVETALEISTGDLLVMVESIRQA